MSEHTDFMKTWPVVETVDFEGIVIDATKWDTGEYTALFNFYHTVAESEDDTNSGFTLTTQISGVTLRELYQKIEMLISVIGVFDGTPVSDHGRLINENGDEIAQICWHQYSDSEWTEDMDDMSGLTITLESDFPPPTMIQ